MLHNSIDCLRNMGCGTISSNFSHSVLVDRSDQVSKLPQEVVDAYSNLIMSEITHNKKTTFVRTIISGHSTSKVGKTWSDSRGESDFVYQLNQTSNPTQHGIEEVQDLCEPSDSNAQPINTGGSAHDEVHKARTLLPVSEELN